MVVVLVGILAAVAIPSLSRTSDVHRVNDVARGIQSRLLEARAEAMARQRSYRFRLATTQYMIESSNGGTWTTVSTINVPAAITVQLDGGSTGTITYQPIGRVDALHTVTVTDGVHLRTLRILVSGLLRATGGMQ